MRNIILAFIFIVCWSTLSHAQTVVVGQYVQPVVQPVVPVVPIVPVVPVHVYVPSIIVQPQPYYVYNYYVSQPVVVQKRCCLFPWLNTSQVFYPAPSGPVIRY